MGAEAGDGAEDSPGCGMLSGPCWVPRSGKPLNSLWQARLCSWVQGCREMGGASFLIMASPAFHSALALCCWGD